MRSALLLVLTVAICFALGPVCCGVANATPSGNHNGKFALNIAGPHGVKTNRCLFDITDCNTQLVTDSTDLSGRYDIHIIAMDVEEIAAGRFGLDCEVTLGPDFTFYDWRNCTDFENPTAGWPGCGEGNAVSWTSPQPGPHVVIGFFDVYLSPDMNAQLCADVDPRVGFAEFCDGSEPAPFCVRTTNPNAFGCVGFNRLGYNPCGIVPVQRSTWGSLKSLYR